MGCFGLRYLHRIRKDHVYAIIFVSKRSADALVHSPMRSKYALYAQTVNILAVSLEYIRARCERAANALRARCERAASALRGHAASALRTRCGRARALANAIKLKYDCSFIHTTGVLHSLVQPSALRTRCRRAADAQGTRSCIHHCNAIKLLLCKNGL